MPRCPNCSAELEHEYRCKCGQRRIHPQDWSARRFVRELADEIANLHSNFKILRSLRGLRVDGRRRSVGRPRQARLSARVYVEANGAILLKEASHSDLSGQQLREPRGNPAHRRARLRPKSILPAEFCVDTCRCSALRRSRLPAGTPASRATASGQPSRIALTMSVQVFTHCSFERASWP